MVYLASPYSHSDPAIEEARFETIAHVAAHLISLDNAIFSPILHCHPIRKLCAVPGDANYWAKYNRAMLSASRGLVIAMMGGWETSLGIANEVRIAKELGKPVLFYDLNTKEIKSQP